MQNLKVCFDHPDNLLLHCSKGRFTPLLHLAAKLLATLFRQQRGPVCTTVQDADHVYQVTFS